MRCFLLKYSQQYSQGHGIGRRGTLGDGFACMSVMHDKLFGVIHIHSSVQCLVIETCEFKISLWLRY